MLKGFLSLVFCLSTFSAFAQVHCFGTEPFWNATLSDQEVEVNMMGGDSYTQKIAGVSGALGFQASFMQVYSNLRGPVAVVKQAECNDGMSDRTYSHEVTIFTDLDTLYGCCRVRSRR